MFLKSMTVLSLVLSAAFASAETHSIETKAGVQEIMGVVEMAGPGCAMGGICASEASDVQCAWHLDAIGKLKTSCEYHVGKSSFYVTGEKAHKLIAYMQISGVPLYQGIPGYLETPAVELKCVTKTALPEASRPESFICEFTY